MPLPNQRYYHDEKAGKGPGKTSPHPAASKPAMPMRTKKASLHGQPTQSGSRLMGVAKVKVHPQSEGIEA